MNTLTPPPDLRARVLEAASREPVPSRGDAVGAWRRNRGLLFGFGALLSVLLLVGPNLSGRPRGYVTAVVVAWLPIAVAATWASVGRGRSMLGRPAHWLLAVIALTPVALMAAWAAVALVWPPALVNAAGTKQHVFCDVVLLVLSVGPLLAFGALRRGSDPVSPRLTGAAIGTAAAAWAAIVHHLLCALTSPFHIMFGHVVPVLAVTMVGTVVTARTVAVRTKTG